MPEPHRRNVLDTEGLGLDAEFFEALAEGVGRWRLERIVSRGQFTAAGEWYDQDQDEWVLLVSGSADLTVETGGDSKLWRLRPGDLVLLPAGCRHRVERTEKPTVWFALHIWADARHAPASDDSQE